jgi:predicted lipoprotein
MSRAAQRHTPLPYGRGSLLKAEHRTTSVSEWPAYANFRNLVLLLIAASLTACVPWTVRPIDDNRAANEGRRFDAKAYVDSIWAARLRPALARGAPDLRSLGALAAGRSYLVKGEGIVLGADAAGQSRHLAIDLLPPDGRADAVLQLGPVVRGTALRDAAGFIDFNQFVNQIDFADVANELNARAVKEVLAPFDLKGIAGARVSFAGAFTARDGAAPEIVPIELSRVGRAQ